MRLMNQPGLGAAWLAFQPTFAPRMMGMAPRMGNAPDPTAVTAMAVVVVDLDQDRAEDATLSPTQGFAAKANMLCAASPLSPAKPRASRGVVGGAQGPSFLMRHARAYGGKGGR